jgi:topoisomerase IV subunit B
VARENPVILINCAIIKLTDADVDGAHIASLIMTFFFQEMRSLINAGHIYLALPPLYRLSHNGLVHYAQDDAEKDHLLKTVFKKYSKIDISRFKGLGEMPVDQLRTTTMDPNKRRLQQVYIKDSETIDDFVNRLMGKNADARYQFIQENATFVKDLDI